MGLEQYIVDLYTDNIFDSFDNLCMKYDLPHSHFIKHLQIRHFPKHTQYFLLFPISHPSATVLDKLSLSFVVKGRLSVLYSEPICLGDKNLNNIKTRREDELHAV